ncbi:MAG: glycoside hydrolase family 43 protein [Lachnospiraceae bacterium]|nr:glycoside hydrolase family 43 protein [Lachnospiraceae bacterium]
MKFKNPILSGYHPDPSICRVGEDYYLVNSTFEFFPGVPVYHSRNLINWELEGYCLTSDEQLPLEKCRPSGGIFAPTIRYHEGTFFMITTNVSSKGNFIVHTKDPARGWSDPVWVDQGGIDPSLLFDDDGTVYFTSTGMDEEGKQGIFLCEVDPFSGERKTESVLISHGCGGRYPEGPHLYKWFGKYYLMLAEGGTEYGHMETLQRAESPYGPYEACPHNPILSHKEDTREKIYSTGHADMLEDHNGNWWMVCLAVRPCGEAPNRVLLHNLGRETFLTPVVWKEDGWPVVGEHGLIAPEMEGPLPGEIPEPVKLDFFDDFGEKEFPLRYNFLRNPHRQHYVRLPQENRMVLQGSSVTLSECDSPTWIGIRQKEFATETSAIVTLNSRENGTKAGITAYYNDSYHYEIYLTREANVCKVCLAKQIHDMWAVTACVEIESTEHVVLKITSDPTYYRFSYSLNGTEFTELGSGLTVGLCTEGTRSMTFTGTYLAMFAEHGAASFEQFHMKVLSRR